MRWLNKKELKIFITFFIIFSLFIHWPGWRENSYLDLTKAIVDEHRLTIDSYYNDTVDRAFYNGHYYSDKAPGLSFLAVPIYAVWKIIYNTFFLFNINDIESYKIVFFNRVPIVNTIPNSFSVGSMILVTILTSSLYGALLVVLIYKVLRYFTTNEKHRLLITLIAGMGSLILPSSTLFGEDVVATFFLFFSFFLLFKAKKEKILDKKYFLLAGFFSAISIVISYTAAAVILPLFIYVLLTFRGNKKVSSYYVTGLILGILPLLLYNYAIFENPFKLTLQYNDPLIWGGVGQGELSMYGLQGLPNPFVALRLTFYPYRGLFYYFPVLLFSLVGLYCMWRHHKTEVALILTSFIILLCYFSARHYWWGGYFFGPRYLIYIIPFFLLPLSYSFKRIYKAIWLPFVIITVIFGLFSLTQWEDKILDHSTGDIKKTYAVKLDSFQVLYNPISEHYIPRFLKWGPRSRIIEGLIDPHRRLDIRDAA